MKKTMMGLAVLAMSMMPAAAMAQTRGNTTDTKTKTEKAYNCQDKEGQCKPGKGSERVCKEQCLFETLNLTDEQKAKVKSLNDARRVSQQEMFEQVKKARAMNDTTFKADKNFGKELNRKYLKDLQTILTADQYVQFLENNYVESQTRAPKGDRMVKPGKMIKNLNGSKARKKSSVQSSSDIKASPAKK